MANILHFLSAFLPVSSLWPCACLCRWLLRHRKIKVPFCRREGGAFIAEATSAFKPHPRAKPECVRRQVLYLATHQDSCRSIAYTFNRWHGCGHGNETIGKSWVAEFIKQHAVEIAEARRTMRRKPPPRVAVNHTWALDLTFLVSPDGLTFTVLGIIDQGSRRLLCLKSLPRKCTFTLLANVFLAIAEYGLPFLQLDSTAPKLGWLDADQSLAGQYIGCCSGDSQPSQKSRAVGLCTGWPDGWVWLAMLKNARDKLNAGFQRCPHADGVDSA